MVTGAKQCCHWHGNGYSIWNVVSNITNFKKFERKECKGIHMIDWNGEIHTKVTLTFKKKTQCLEKTCVWYGQVKQTHKFLKLFV